MIRFGVGPKNVSSSNRNGIPGRAPLRYPHRTTLRLRPPGASGCCPDRRSAGTHGRGPGKKRLRGTRPGRHCRSGQDGVSFPAARYRRVGRSEAATIPTHAKATKRRLLRTACTWARRARRSVAVTRDVVADWPVGTGRQPTRRSRARVRSGLRVESSYRLTTSALAHVFSGPHSAPTAPMPAGPAQLHRHATTPLESALIAPRDREAEEAHRFAELPFTRRLARSGGSHGPGAPEAHVCVRREEDLEWVLVLSDVELDELAGRVLASHGPVH